MPPPTATPLVKPKNVYQALEHLRWREALFSEFKSFLDNKAFHVTDWPRDDPGAIIVQLMPLLSTKERADLQEALCKARFVANGAKLVGAPGTPETYSSTPSREAFRIFLHAVVALELTVKQFDVKTAFLLPRLKEDQKIYLRPFPGFELLCNHFQVPFKRGQVLRANSAIYGLPQAGRAWSKEFTGFMTGEGFEPVVTEPSLFLRRKPFALVITHVDDSYAAADTSTLKIFQDRFAKRFPIKDLGVLGQKPMQFLGMEVVRPDPNTIFVSQEAYTRKILLGAGFNDCHPVKTPASMTKIGFVESKLLDLDSHGKFRKVNGELQYLLLTRLDCCFAVNQCCRFNNAPTEEAQQAQKRILRYLKHTEDFRLIYRTQPPPYTLRVFSDSDWAGAFDKATTGGFLIYLGETLISWRVATHKGSPTSTFDAESKIAQDAVKEAICVHATASAILEIQSPILLFVDNSATVDNIRSGAVTRLTRHVGSRIRFLADLEEDKVIKTSLVASAKQLADFLTKPLALDPWISALEALGPWFFCAPCAWITLSMWENGSEHSARGSSNHGGVLCLFAKLPNAGRPEKHISLNSACCFDLEIELTADSNALHQSA